MEGNLRRLRLIDFGIHNREYGALGLRSGDLARDASLFVGHFVRLMMMVAIAVVVLEEMEPAT